MKAARFELMSSATSPDHYPRAGLPEIAVAGRSNVGKSSLINVLLHQKRAARVSATPGKTRAIQFLKINDEFVLADLPGYGFAKVAAEVGRGWRQLIEVYLSSRSTLCGAVLLIDSRHPRMASDRQMYDWLRHWRIPVVLVATKRDKLSRSAWIEARQEMRRALELKDQDEIIPFSAATGEGREPLWRALEELWRKKSVERGGPNLL